VKIEAIAKFIYEISGLAETRSPKHVKSPIGSYADLVKRGAIAQRANLNSRFSEPLIPNSP
jgi:hypothetical protein